MSWTPLFNVESMCTQPFGITAYSQKNRNYATDSQTGLRYHEGIDLVPKGRSDYRLYSPFKGKVMWVGEGRIYGHNLMLWDSDARISYRFCHLAEIHLKEGDRVKPGWYIGVAGNSGASAGAHLHLNAVPMAEWGRKLCPWNGRGGRVDPLGLLVAAGVHI